MDFSLKLHEAIAAVCPITGVSVGERTNKLTWRIDFAPGATAPQIAAARQVVNNYDLAQAEAAAIARARRAARAAAIADILVSKGIITEADLL